MDLDERLDNVGLTLEWSSDGGTTWAQADPADSMTALTSTGAKVKSFTQKAAMYRLSWTITGTTPSVTFSAKVFVGA